MKQELKIIAVEFAIEGTRTVQQCFPLFLSDLLDMMIIDVVFGTS